jgi:hypothetical protein
LSDGHPGQAGDAGDVLRASATELAGRALFPASYQTQAEIKDVAVAATVSLIDPGINQTIGTSLTGPDGSFLLQFGANFAPGAQPYILEAVKGLSGNKAGNSAVRVRTIIRFRNGAWEFMSFPGLTINRATTAVSVIASLRSLDPAQFIGKVNIGANPAFIPSGTSVSLGDYLAVLALVDEALTANRDPLDAILWSPSRGYYLKQGTGDIKVNEPRIFSVLPDPAATLGNVTLIGENLGAGYVDRVDFADPFYVDPLPAPVVDTASNQVVVTVPASVSAGVRTVRLQNEMGIATAAITIVGAVGGALGPRGYDVSATGSLQPKMYGGFAADGDFTNGYADPARTPGPKPTGPVGAITGDVNAKGSGPATGATAPPLVVVEFDCPTPTSCPTATPPPPFWPKKRTP